MARYVGQDLASRYVGEDVVARYLGADAAWPYVGDDPFDPFALEDSYTGSVPPNTSQTVVTFNRTPVAGEVIAIFIGSDVRHTAFMSGYIQQDSTHGNDVNGGGNKGAFLKVLTRVADGSETGVTIPSTNGGVINNGCSFGIAMWSGIDTSSLFVVSPQHIHDQGESNAAAFPSMDIQTVPALACAAGQLDDHDTTVTGVPAGYTLTLEAIGGGDPNSTATIGIAFKVITDTGTEQPSDMIFGETDRNVGVSFAFRGSAV